MEVIINILIGLKDFIVSNIIPIITGVVSGIAATYIYMWMQKRTERKKFRFHHGIFKKYFPNTDKLFSQAEIISGSQTILTINVTTYLDESGNPMSPQLWTGQITMKTNNTGILYFEYVQPPNWRNGFKGVIFDQNLKRLTVSGESENEGYGREEFYRE